MKRTKHTALALLLALCFTLGLLPALTVTAGAAGVSYLDASGATQTAASATSVTASDTAWNAGWYVVDSILLIPSRITVTGDVHLILADNCTLTASAGIAVTGSNSLTIYGQTAGTGTLSATGGQYQAGIGGNGGGAGGTITINGGAVNATGASNGGAGIGGGGGGGAGGTITINGGAVNANGGQWSAGIGGGSNGAGGAITINGGTVTATGDTNGAGIGGGSAGTGGGTITINGGMVTATGGNSGAGIGGGYQGASGKITINGGTVNANGNVGGDSSYGGAGIGGGMYGNNSIAGNSITITGGTVTATVPDGTLGAAIGTGGGTNLNSGLQATDASVTIGAGATVEAGPSASALDNSATAETVKNNTNYKYAKITLVVAVTGVTLSPTTLNLTAGGSPATLTATVSPSNATNKTITWSTSAASVATVSNGVVTPVGAGTATITVTATNGTDDTSDDKTATCTVTVAAVPVSGVTLNQTTLTLTAGGGTATLTATVAPDNATDKTVTWASDTPAVATVDSSGVVTPIAVGTATITVTSNADSAKTATCTVTVIPPYAVTTSDGKTTETKYHYGGEDITLSVIVSGADFEGGEFTLNYDSATLEVKTFPANNKFADSEQTAGSVKFEALNKAKITNGNALATITFTVKTKVTTDTTCNFTFTGTPKICYNTNEDSVAAATVTPGSVIVEPVTYAVTLTGNDGVTFVDSSNATITTDTAIESLAFTAKMGAEFDANNYSYTVTLKIGGTEVTTPPTVNSDGTITIPADSVTIPDSATDKTIVLTVGRTLDYFTVTTTDDYVTGWTLVTVAKASGRTDDPVYNYDGNPMYYVNAYSAYAYLVNVNGSVTVDAAKAKVSLGTAAAATIAAGYDVNNTNKVDYSDALLTYRCYEIVHQTPATAMETYLRADVDASKKVDTTDVSAIDSNRTPEMTPG